MKLKILTLHDLYLKLQNDDDMRCVIYYSNISVKDKKENCKKYTNCDFDCEKCEIYPELLTEK